MPFNVHSRDDEWRDNEMIEDDFPIDESIDDAAIDEALLTDDLLEFAAQLGDDALHLQACYPAHRTSTLEAILNDDSLATTAPKKPIETIAKPRKKRWAALAFGFGAVCVLVGVVLVSVRSLNDEVASTMNAPATVPSDSLARVEVRTTDFQAIPHPSSEDSLYEAAGTTTPTITEIGNATGPQLEALYDYLEDEDHEVRLSI